MGNSLYFKLAFNNIKRDKNINIPYIIAVITTVMSYFLVLSMLFNEGIKNIAISADTLKQIFEIGKNIMTFIIFIFMIYMNNFIIKKRLKEFGLYNILGLEKKHISYIIFIENGIIFLCSILAGILCGLVFGRAFFMLLLKLCGTAGEIKYILEIEAFTNTLVLFAILYLVTSIINIIIIYKNKTIDLMKSDKYGEKKSKAILIISEAIIGFLMLIYSYYKAMTINNSFEALAEFLLLVIFVILATLLIFRAGSITILNILKKNKRFYYKTNNFVSTSSLIYRMRQNADALTNICIFSTMILVTSVGCLSLYFGAEKILNLRHQVDMTINLKYTGINKNILEETAKKHNITIDKYFELEYLGFSSIFSDNNILSNNELNKYKDKNNYSILNEMCGFTILTQEQFNQAYDVNVDLNKDELAIISNFKLPNENMIKISNKEYKIKEILKNSNLVAKDSEEEMILITYNKNISEKIMKSIIGNKKEVDFRNYMNLNYSGKKDDKLEFVNDIMSKSKARRQISDINYDRLDLYSLFGGLLFIGIFFITIFLAIMILIIYFKQISEGYDDKDRFIILQKVGMDKKMVKKTINKQILIVFFMPLIGALCHMLAATNLIQMVLRGFYLYDKQVIFNCILGTSIAFALLYIIVYKLTAKVYYRLVEM